MRLPLIAYALAALFASTAHAADTPPVYGAQLEGFEYPYTLQHYRFESQGTELQMGYMDVAAAGKANGHTIVLLHGKNFCAATWEATIKVLTGAGYRVIAPDQIGFCTSSKPEHYQYSFQQLASNTHALLNELGIKDAAVLGHSTGGMLATRYALLYPEDTERLMLVNPIGLEDWKALGVPYRTVDDWFARETRLTADSIRDYERKTYYGGRWAPAYERWVTMLAGLNQGPGHNVVAWNSALIYDMIFTQPVVYELDRLKVPTLLLIGTADTTAIGSDIAPPEVKAKLGHYDVLGKQASQRIPGATLVEFPGLGHAPQMEQPDQFHKAMLAWLAQPVPALVDNQE
ncbi:MULTISPECIES: alpha/beta fold hydrolase [Pseudomonas]|uniref:Alpha/beta hydrolase n=1 Tax=Pseudomonas quercus TaxID=2722792 RepID=A0ABX0Y900_9PSED|nr:MULTISPECIES: alpha/beta hydrolase [Pseudomonas]MBF7140905.1 alpha/beta hydrolase [Pseudomonas sp. LY10J]NJO99439.1 alpha/beta hydrolase [Pseudomonas quercus]